MKLMKTRDDLKKEAVDLTKDGKDATEAWTKFKKLRNKINNIRKFEERQYKVGKINSSLDSPTNTWKTAKKIHLGLLVNYV